MRDKNAPEDRLLVCTKPPLSTKSTSEERPTKHRLCHQLSTGRIVVFCSTVYIKGCVLEYIWSVPGDWRGTYSSTVEHQVRESLQSTTMEPLGFDGILHSRILLECNQVWRDLPFTGSCPVEGEMVIVTNWSRRPGGIRTNENLVCFLIYMPVFDHFILGRVA